MAETKLISEVGRKNDDSCDIRVWSAACEHATSESIAEKYVCDYCVKIGGIDHLVERAPTPYVSGDYSRLS